MERFTNPSRKIVSKGLGFWNEYVWPLASTVMFARPLHFALTRVVADIQPKDKVLELFSGYPWYEAYADKVGKDGLFVALDVNYQIQNRSKFLGGLVDKYLRRKNTPTVQHLVANGYEDLPFADNTFDFLLVNQSTLSNREAYRVLKPGGALLISHAEALTLPISSASSFKDFRKSKFQDVKMFLGAPSTAFTILAYAGIYGHIPSSAWMFSGFNWYVSARKPISRERSRRLRR